MTRQQALSPRLWPHPFHPANFLQVFRDVPLLRYTWNTCCIATLSSVGVVLSCVPVAYALSRHALARPPGRVHRWCSPR